MPFPFEELMTNEWCGLEKSELSGFIDIYAACGFLD